MPKAVRVTIEEGSDPMADVFELGLYTFGELTPDARTGKAISARQRLADILAAAKLADAAGLDVFAVGEHHRLDMAISATPVQQNGSGEVSAPLNGSLENSP